MEAFDEQTTQYIRRTLRKNQGLLREMEEFASPRYIPILKPEAASLLRMLTKIKRPQRILEIGTAIGYSAIMLSEAAGKNAKVFSIERDEEMYRLALEYIRRSGANVYVTLGEADEELEKMKEQFDLIFIDAAKGQYPRFFAYAERLLAPDGIIVMDNVLFHGRVVHDELAIRKSRTITTRLDEFLKEICQNPRYETTLVPTGDGIAITRLLNQEG